MYVGNKIKAGGAEVVATALAHMPRLTALDVGGIGEHRFTSWMLYFLPHLFVPQSGLGAYP